MGESPRRSWRALVAQAQAQAQAQDHDERAGAAAPTRCSNLRQQQRWLLLPQQQQQYLGDMGTCLGVVQMYEG